MNLKLLISFSQIFPLVANLQAASNEVDYHTNSTYDSNEYALRDEGLRKIVEVTVMSTNSFNFGTHARHQCNNPVKTLTNKDSNAQDLRIPPRRSNGSCSKDICIGDCVAIVVNAGSDKGKSHAINVIAGGDLPDPGNCSDKAEERNDPPGWDFTANGACGKGADGNGFWKNCLVHDTCVWARCRDDKSVPGGIGINGGKTDEYCGRSFKHAREDYAYSHGFLPECWSNSQCADPLTCLLQFCISPQPEGSYCDSDNDCLGYCHLFKCYDGSKNDMCGKDSDCKSDLSCQFYNGLKKCRPKKKYGDWCGQDADCGSGMYCQFTKCRDGRRKDKCRRSSECQGSLKCKRRCRICAQKECR
jgi:hypothetical protein